MNQVIKAVAYIYINRTDYKKKKLMKALRRQAEEFADEADLRVVKWFYKKTDTDKTDDNYTSEAINYHKEHQDIHYAIIVNAHDEEEKLYVSNTLYHLCEPVSDNEDGKTHPKSLESSKGW